MVFGKSRLLSLAQLSICLRIALTVSSTIESSLEEIESQLSTLSDQIRKNQNRVSLLDGLRQADSQRSFDYDSIFFDRLHHKIDPKEMEVRYAKQTLESNFIPRTIMQLNSTVVDFHFFQMRPHTKSEVERITTMSSAVLTDDDTIHIFDGFGLHLASHKPANMTNIQSIGISPHFDDLFVVSLDESNKMGIHNCSVRRRKMGKNVTQETMRNHILKGSSIAWNVTLTDNFQTNLYDGERFYDLDLNMDGGAKNKKRNKSKKQQQDERSDEKKIEVPSGSITTTSLLVTQVRGIKLIVIGDNHGYLHILNTKGELMKNLKLPVSRVNSLVKMNHLAVYAGDGTVQFMDPYGGKLLETKCEVDEEIVSLTQDGHRNNVMFALGNKGSLFVLALQTRPESQACSVIRKETKFSEAITSGSSDERYDMESTRGFVMVKARESSRMLALNTTELTNDNEFEFFDARVTPLTQTTNQVPETTEKAVRSTSIQSFKFPQGGSLVLAVASDDPTKLILYEVLLPFKPPEPMDLGSYRMPIFIFGFVLVFAWQIFKTKSSEVRQSNALATAKKSAPGLANYGRGGASAGSRRPRRKGFQDKIRASSRDETGFM